MNPILPKSKSFLLLFLALFFMITSAYAQPTVMVTGNIINSTSLPLGPFEYGNGSIWFNYVSGYYLGIPFKNSHQSRFVFMLPVGQSSIVDLDWMADGTYYPKQTTLCRFSVSVQSAHHATITPISVPSNRFIACVYQGYPSNNTAAFTLSMKASFLRKTSHE